MAIGFAAYAVPDTHISYLHEHLGFVHSYLDGASPESADLSSLPGEWPEQPLESLGSWGINHRNVDLYHWILNGGPELVSGSGSIFQTWYEPDQHSAVKLDKHNERFAFHASQINELAALVAKVDVESVRQAFSAWCKKQGKNYEPDVYACQPFVDEFKKFGDGLRDVMSRGLGIVW